MAAAKLADERPGQTLQATALVHEAYHAAASMRPSLISVSVPQPTHERGVIARALRACCKKGLSIQVKSLPSLHLRLGSISLSLFSKHWCPHRKQPPIAKRRSRGNSADRERAVIEELSRSNKNHETCASSGANRSGDHETHSVRFTTRSSSFPRIARRQSPNHRYCDDISL